MNNTSRIFVGVLIGFLLWAAFALILIDTKVSRIEERIIPPQKRETSVERFQKWQEEQEREILPPLDDDHFWQDRKLKRLQQDLDDLRAEQEERNRND
jgi:gas vesicle protein